jgi:hypothetical protein
MTLDVQRKWATQLGFQIVNFILNIMEIKLVSILCPVYNAEKTIE